RPTVLVVLLRRSARPALLPYTTLFRSAARTGAAGVAARTGAAGPVPVPVRRLLMVARVRRGPSALTVVRVPVPPAGSPAVHPGVDRKSTRLNSSHVKISYAVFCLRKQR